MAAPMPATITMTMGTGIMAMDITAMRTIMKGTRTITTEQGAGAAGDTDL